ncbi:MAG: hypothetical protein ABIL46_03590 [candidate division WOR-3 bacterium]
MKEIIEGLKLLNKRLNRVIKLLNAYSRLKDKAVENVYLLERRLNEISKEADNLPDFEMKNSLIVWLNSEKSAVDKIKEDFRFSLAERIKELFQKENWIIKGQYPILRIGLYTLSLNFEFGEATLYFGPEIEKIKSKIALEPETIYQTIKKFDEGLKRMKFDPKEFYLDLQKSYKKCILLLNKPHGEKVYLTEVLSEYVILKQPSQFFADPKKSNFREFPRINLSYWLYLFKKSEYAQKGIHFYIATFDATTDKMHAIWIPDNEEGEGTYYSYVSFAE